ncbi:MAG: Crp/Fnr family transcriptional regulator [Candidatus Levybacteria bacterium]|nr:Crp/Fnr family transcriptional regulator [Candidatus Levybacteria bacterium]
MNNSIQQKIDKFFSKFEILNYRKGESVIRPEDTPRGVYYVKSGYVKMNLILENGRELTVNIFKKGSYFPMMWAISNISNTYYYQVMSKSQLRRIPKEKFLDFLRGNPDVVFELLSRILVGFNALVANIEHMLSGSAYDRIIAVLLLLGRRFGEKMNGKDGAVIVRIPLTHQDIANIAAITRETASIAIKQVEKKKLIGRKGKFLIIKNLSGLVKEKEPILQKETYDLPLAA